jgi:two-component system OmpR family sensor kinase
VPLRVRLVIILVLLVAVGLGAVLSITYSTTRNSLVANVDSQLDGSVGTWTSYFRWLDQIPGSPPPSVDSVLQPETYAGLYTTQGGLISFPPIGFEGREYTSNPVYGCSTCRLPTLGHSLLARLTSSPDQVVFGSVSGRGGGFEIAATVLDFRDGEAGASTILVIGLPLGAVNLTMRHLLDRDLLVGIAVLVALGAVSWFLVRLGLLPLERMAATATEIAAGDLTKRVEDTDERTEVGQLGGALNVMLTQIERAFRERAASEERLRRFVGDASHELRTPLTSIRGYAELFKDGSVGRPEDLAAALGRIESESARMGGLVDDLLLLARLDQGRPLGNDRVDLSELAADAVLDASVVDPSRSISLISTGPCVVIGDDQRLRQVLGNLVSNAITYSPAGSPIEVAVHVDWPPVDVSGLPGVPSLPAVGMFGRRTRAGRSYGPNDPPTGPVRPLSAADLAGAGHGPEGHYPNGSSTPAGSDRPSAVGPAGSEAAPGLGPNGAVASPPPPPPPPPAPAPSADWPWQGGRVALAVIDHGPGIAAENVPHVFERFWRADQSRQRSRGGTGLGLSIVAAVVAAHGGQVAIRQTPGGGATFVVELPTAPPEGSTPAGDPLPEVVEDLAE